MNKANEETAASVNKGISLAQGECLFLASSDDIYEADAVRDFEPRLQNDDGVGLVCGDSDFRLSKLCRFLFLNRVYAHYRLHPGNAHKVFTERHFRDLVLIMIREADYCAQNRLTPEWRRLHGYEHRVEAAERAKEEVIRAQQAALESVFSSWSWRWTAPLRWLSERVRGGR